MIKDSGLVTRPYRSKTIKSRYKLSKSDKVLIFIVSVILAAFTGFMVGLVVGVDKGYDKGIKTVITD